MDLREIGWRDVDWIQLAQDRNRWRAIVDAVMNLRVIASRSQLLMHFSYAPLRITTRLLNFIVLIFV
jgi:hypothetical protein